jgi:hypothetical protein
MQSQHTTPFSTFDMNSFQNNHLNFETFSTQSSGASASDLRESSKQASLDQTLGQIIYEDKENFDPNISCSLSNKASKSLAMKKNKSASNRAIPGKKPAKK